NCQDQNEAEKIVNTALKERINLRLMNGKQISIALDEATTDEDLRKLVSICALGKPVSFDEQISSNFGIPKNLERTSTYLQHEVFNLFRSETELQRYI